MGLFNGFAWALASCAVIACAGAVDDFEPIGTDAQPFSATFTTNGQFGTTVGSAHTQCARTSSSQVDNGDFSRSWSGDCATD